MFQIRNGNNQSQEFDLNEITNQNSFALIGTAEPSKFVPWCTWIGMPLAAVVTCMISRQLEYQTSTDSHSANSRSHFPSRRDFIMFEV